MPAERTSGADREDRRRRSERTRRWFALPLSIFLAVMSVTACASANRSSTPDQVQAPAQGQAQSSAAASDPAPSTPICGVPPCDRYLSRSETRTLNSTITDHPIASAIALHVAVGLVCGAVLCVWGEGFTLAYVQHEAQLAAQNGECLRADILPKGREWQLVRLTATNQSPYCTD
jgi:hypothetical protein